jgi:hypothetical protein
VAWSACRARLLELALPEGEQPQPLPALEADALLVRMLQIRQGSAALLR